VSCRCQSCNRRFSPLPHIKNQQFCSRKQCQAERRRGWRRLKLATDEDYKNDQQAAQRRWLDTRPDYYLIYRAAHPDYTEGNRTQQRERNRRRRHGGQRPAESPGGMIAKSDAYRAKNHLISGLYHLCVVCDPVIAKSDALIVRLQAISSC